MSEIAGVQGAVDRCDGRSTPPLIDGERAMANNPDPFGTSTVIRPLDPKGFKIPGDNGKLLRDFKDASGKALRGVGDLDRAEREARRNDGNGRAFGRAIRSDGQSAARTIGAAVPKQELRVTSNAAEAFPRIEEDLSDVTRAADEPNLDAKTPDFDDPNRRAKTGTDDLTRSAKNPPNVGEDGELI